MVDVASGPWPRFLGLAFLRALRAPDRCLQNLGIGPARRYCRGTRRWTTPVGQVAAVADSKGTSTRRSESGLDVIGGTLTSRWRQRELDGNSANSSS